MIFYLIISSLLSFPSCCFDAESAYRRLHPSSGTTDLGGFPTSISGSVSRNFFTFECSKSCKYRGIGLGLGSLDVHLRVAISNYGSKPDLFSLDSSIFFWVSRAAAYRRCPAISETLVQIPSDALSELHFLILMLIFWLVHYIAVNAATLLVLVAVSLLVVVGVSASVVIWLVSHLPHQDPVSLQSRAFPHCRSPSTPGDT